MFDDRLFRDIETMVRHVENVTEKPIRVRIESAAVIGPFLSDSQNNLNLENGIKMFHTLKNCIRAVPASVISNNESKKKIKKKASLAEICKGAQKRRRKYSKDSFHKKIKRLFMNFLRKHCQRIVTTKLAKIPQKVITDVSITYNKKLFQSTINEFFTSFCHINIEEDAKNEGKVIDQKLRKFLDLPLKDCFRNHYLKDYFYNDLLIIQQKENESFCNKLQELSKTFIDYYLSFKPYQKKFRPQYEQDI